MYFWHLEGGGGIAPSAPLATHMYYDRVEVYCFCSCWLFCIKQSSSLTAFTSLLALNVHVGYAKNIVQPMYFGYLTGMFRVQ